MVYNNIYNKNERKKPRYIFMVLDDGAFHQETNVPAPFTLSYGKCAARETHSKSARKDLFFFLLLLLFLVVVESMDSLQVILVNVCILHGNVLNSKQPRII